MSRILNRAGASSEVMVNDVGEDLLVQTQHQAEADAFNLLVQVKSTSLKPRADGTFAIRVDVEHLYRWSSHMDPVLLCIFDDRTNLVYALFVKYYYSLWHLSTTNNKTLMIKFSEDNLLTGRSAKRMIWSCRIDYYERMLQWYDAALSDAMSLELGRRRVRHFANERNLVGLRMLQAIGAVKGDTVALKIRRGVENASRRFANENEKSDEKLTLRDACGLALLGFVDDVFGMGLPSMVIEVGAHVLQGALSQFHPKLWSRVAARFEGPA